MAESNDRGVSRSVAESLDLLATQFLLEGREAFSVPLVTALENAARAEGRVTLANRLLTIIAEIVQIDRAEIDAQHCQQWIEELRRLIEDSPAPLPLQGLEHRRIPVKDHGAFAADSEMIAEFITEAREHLVASEEMMLLIEKDSTDVESINAVFRGFHTIKGLAGFLELGAIQETAHEVETLLDLARTKKLMISPPAVDAVFAGMDFIRTKINQLEQAGSGQDAGQDVGDPALLEHIRVVGTTVMQHAEPITLLPQEEERLIQPPIQTLLEDVSAAASSTESAAVVAPREERRSSDTSSVRIETAKLDHLMNMVGEMVIAQTLISHNPSLSAYENPRLMADIGLLTRITSDVQKITTSMRMVPIGLQFQKTARLIRDLSRQVGKQIELVTSGEDTELDKTIAEELADPLLHMVRNSIDHGIETPEQRRLAGKNSTAKIRLAAYHESGQIVIEISDDGRGLDREKILAKATERGLVRSSVPMPDSDVFLLIFEPGFSTADTVTGISGRGVGMDVVKKHVQTLRGRIEIQSEAGKGATFFLRMPLTLAIIEGLIVRVGDSRYILPLFTVTEMFRPTSSVLSTIQGRGEMAVVRGSLLPVVRLHDRFNLLPRSRALLDGMLVVAESQGKRFCLFVDELMGKQEVVIKSLGETFKEVVGLAGCAILGDGRVGLILDVDGIFRGRS